MTEKLHFEIMIHAPVQKVWDTMLQKNTYEQWTVAFDPTSTYEGSWEKGSTIKFISTSGGGGGMQAEIADNVPLRFLSIKHIGEIKDGTLVEFPKPGFENYTFTEMGGDTKLEIDNEFDIPPEIKEMFADMWPKALAILKEICER